MKLEHESKLARYKADRDTDIEMLKSVFETSKIALTSSILINGGAAAALLALIGNLFGKGGGTSSVPLPLVFGLVAFTLGVLFGGLATAGAYFTQYCYNHKHHRSGVAFHIATILLIIGSYAAFLGGIVSAYRAFVSPTAGPSALYPPPDISVLGNVMHSLGTPSDTLLAAVIAASVALIVAFLNSIGAEIYRRHRDKMALAAGIAGELSSYEHALPILQNALRTAIERVDSGDRTKLAFRPFEKPRDFIYEKAVEKLGLLGPTLVRDIAYVYGNLNGFRASFALITTHFSEMSDLELKGRCIACLEALERAAKTGVPLLEALNRVAKVKKSLA